MTEPVEINVTVLGKGTAMPVHRVAMALVAMSLSVAAPGQASAHWQGGQWPSGGQQVSGNRQPWVAHLHNGGGQPTRLSVTNYGNGQGYVPPVQVQPVQVQPFQNYAQRNYQPYQQVVTTYGSGYGAVGYGSGYGALPGVGVPFRGNGLIGGFRPGPYVPSREFMHLAGLTFMANTGIGEREAMTAVGQMLAQSMACARDTGGSARCSVTRGGVVFDYGHDPKSVAMVTRADQGGYGAGGVASRIVAMETPRGLIRGPAFRDVMLVEEMSNQMR